VLLDRGGESTIGKLILSPTRTYAPLLKKLLTEDFEDIHGLIHCSGGGQTKCLKYLHMPMRVVKDNLFPIPEIFRLIRESSQSSLHDMFEVFNMGCRMEIYCPPAAAQRFIHAASGFGIDARIIGRVEAHDKKELLIKHEGQNLVYA
ncbi:MAG TPA: AIR synthase-related protein, partial [Ferruginibacter sp.]|nr:AIR synthase-related protein [Ferruginibacter sp.]